MHDPPYADEKCEWLFQSNAYPTLGGQDPAAGRYVVNNNVVYLMLTSEATSDKWLSRSCGQTGTIICRNFHKSTHEKINVRISYEWIVCVHHDTGDGNPGDGTIVDMVPSTNLLVLPSSFPSLLPSLLPSSQPFMLPSIRPRNHPLNSPSLSLSAQPSHQLSAFSSG